MEQLLLTIESEKSGRIFSVLDRSSSWKIQTYFEIFESLLFNINARKEETSICGVFKIDISDTYHQHYKNVINSFHYELQNAEPTRVTKFTVKYIDDNSVETIERSINPEIDFQQSLRSAGWIWFFGL